MKSRLILTFLTAWFASFILHAQSSTVFTDANEAYKRGEAFMEKGLLDQAQQEFQQTIAKLKPVNEPEAELLLTKAEFNYAKCAVQLNDPDGEKLILDFIRSHRPDPIANDALVEIANYYYNDGKYEKAVEYYSQVPTGGMTREQRSEVRFKMGYSFFVQKRFPQAKANFAEIKDFDNEYYYPTNYYLGLCYFYESNYDQAISQFRVVEKSKKYKPYIPYYLTQIYFAERRFDELIAYAEPRLQEAGLRNTTEINQLVGQAYFEKGDYKKALPYLEYYAERSGKMREEEWYQLGFAQYQAGDYQKAVRSLSELSSVDSPMGQSAMYYLADANLKLGRKTSARTALASAKRMNYDTQIQEEALFNYGKLSYELKDPREAIGALQTFGPGSRYYVEAQTLMSEIFLSYRDYKQALEVLENMPNKSPQLQKSYQQVTYLRALQLMQENDLEGAKLHFNKSLQFPTDLKTKALATYWLADISHRQENYDQSIRQTNEFLTMAKTMSNLPDEASMFTGNYLQGYNYLKQNNYTAALGFFQEAANGITRNKAFIGNNDVKDRVLGDAILRAGDCNFKRNNYDQAIKYYDQAIDQRYSGFVYAIYQKAIIEGLRGRVTDKILALERIAREFPKSDYADEALLQLGITYQEIGQLNKAVPPLRTLVTDYKNSSNLITKGLIQLGLISYNQGSLETAINYYKQVFSNNPEPSDASLALAALEEIYVDDMGRADEYFAFLETIPGYKVDNLSKDSINFKAAESQFENGNYSRAITAYTDYLRKFPNGLYNLTAFYHRAESNAVLRQYTEALQDYETVIGKGNSKFYAKSLEKAAIIAYNHSLDFNKSYTYYSQLEAVASTDEERFEAQLGALRSAYRLNNTQAVYTLANKVASNPSASQEQAATAHFYIGKINYDRKDYDGALTSLNKVIQMSDNEQTAEARYLKAYIYYLKRDLNTAQTLCLNSNKESSAYPFWVAKSIILLSDILSEKGDLYNARAALEALLENYNEDQELVQTARTKLERINQQLNQNSKLRAAPDPNRLELDNSNNN
ncbi:MAG TPA: tetratricopeptide repeat protein [Flavilitoribacter sp.]|nr:tetratricopeptide repeat protein [Flavilitoribacter sp.]